MSEINTTPLVDVMLVLLIIFLITIPVITKTVPVKVPKAVNIPTQTKPENITVSVTADGDVYWGHAARDRHEYAGAEGRAGGRQGAAARDPYPWRRQAEYKNVGKVIAAIKRGGMVKVGFITEPDHGVRGYR